MQGQIQFVRKKTNLCVWFKQALNSHYKLQITVTRNSLISICNRRACDDIIIGHFSDPQKNLIGVYKEADYGWFTHGIKFKMLFANKSAAAIKIHLFKRSGKQSRADQF